MKYSPYYTDGKLFLYLPSSITDGVVENTSVFLVVVCSSAKQNSSLFLSMTNLKSCYLMVNKYDALTWF